LRKERRSGRKKRRDFSKNMEGKREGKRSKGERNLEERRVGERNVDGGDDKL